CQGVQKPLYASAGGKALLAAYAEAVTQRLYPAELLTFTPHTIPTREALQAEIERVRAEGIAVARNEFVTGISSLAMAVVTGMGVYAFEVTLPDARFDAREEEIRAALRSHHQQVLGEAIAFQKDKMIVSLGMR